MCNLSEILIPSPGKNCSHGSPRVMFVCLFVFFVCFFLLFFFSFFIYLYIYIYIYIYIYFIFWEVYAVDRSSWPLSVHVSCYEPPHDKTDKMACAPNDDSDQPGNPPSLIRVFAVCSMGSLGPKLFSCWYRRLWSDWADAQADLSLLWAHIPFRWFSHEARTISEVM